MLKKTGLVAVGIMTLLVMGCTPDYPNCKKDKHCHEGEYCVNNICQQCRDNGDCPEGQECSAGGCRDIDDYCSAATDCANGQICKDNRCGPCMSAEDCDGDNVCLEGLCTTAECQSEADCPAGLSCVNYKCEAGSGSQSELGAGDCQLKPLYFEFDSFEVSGEMRTVLNQNFDCITQRGGNVLLEGHCDAMGTTEYNMALGERRARMVQKLMKKMGMEPSKMKIVSKGEEEAEGTDSSSRAKDRRVDFE